MFLSSGNRDLGVASKIHPWSQASSQVETKNSALLSSCDGYLLEPIEWAKGSQASCGVLREDSGLLSRPCRKRRASFHDDGQISWFFLSCGATFGVFLELPRGTKGDSRVVPRKSSFHSSCEGERSFALDSLQRNLASRRTEGGISMSFLNCGRKPWVSSTCKVTSWSFSLCLLEVRDTVDLEGPLGLPWSWCNGRAPHRELRQEPQGSSPVLTWVSGCGCRFKQGGRSRRV